MAQKTVFHGPNAGYVMELYEAYQENPDAVDAGAREFFATWRPPARDGAAAVAGLDAALVVAAVNYANAVRRHGHLVANLSPIGSVPAETPPELDPREYQITDQDLAKLPPDAVAVWSDKHFDNALEAIDHLRAVYSGPTAYEFLHIQDRKERYWLREAAESGRYEQALTSEEKQALLKRLTEVEAFERFLHQTYLGQKRFSVEGNDTVVPMLDEAIRIAAGQGVGCAVIGMAHRGRLNVLAHVLGKPYELILSEFEHLPYRQANGRGNGLQVHYSGDVKYHMGWELPVPEGAREGQIPVILAPNPSHLEWVNPVVEGMARAFQDLRDQPGAPRQEFDNALPILLHGDAAFPGQGVVAETLNMARLKGFTTGGTIHIITNNQIGYTTDPEDSRSTLYASDLAKGFEIPIVHVNADDPGACMAVIRMAMDYRARFHADFLIDLVGYRRWGHNEGDEPGFTQPQMYDRITSHPTSRALWTEKLIAEGIVEEGAGDRLLNESMDALQELRDELRASANGDHDEADEEPAEDPPNVETEVGAEQLSTFNEALHSFPEDFTVNSKLRRQLDRRRSALEEDGSIDWAHAETLAFASLLAEGIPIRMTGQDTQRGTFGQRHLVLHDPESGTAHSLLENLPQAKASFASYNSPLSEAGVVGFEYGYSITAPNTFVIWEAQFGDFANGAQVIIDQFFASGGAKWGQAASLTLLLPHGYEGQGPEHSSARLERFLQLAANNNLRVLNMTTSAQYFHALRRHAKLIEHDPRPMVVMTPKSLLRHPRAASTLVDLASGRFLPVIDDDAADGRREEITRLVLCSGKVFVDLVGSDARENSNNVAIIRVEELYPFPASELREVLGGYPNAGEIVWVQEEPQNMGAWTYIAPRLRELAGEGLPISYIGRPAEASPAEGSVDDHNEEQARIVSQTFETTRVLEEAAADD
ncbi:2-oxoglutarate dehydrogenase E1 component [soil metagenome]